MPRLHRLERSQRLERPVAEVFAFFADAANLEAITPRFLRFRVLTPAPIQMRAGTRIDYALSLFGVRLRWVTRITVWEPEVRFVDEQESGPYARWRHTHFFVPEGSGTIMSDVVEYALPFGPLGSLAHALFIRRTLGRIFDHRAAVIPRLVDGQGSAA